MRMKNSTLSALAQFSQNEKKLTDSVLSGADGVGNEEFRPRTSTVQNILNYSKALSVRKSDQISEMFMVLN